MNNREFRTNNFDLIRLLAALQVAFIHGYEHFGVQSLPWLRTALDAFPGVPIFFVISGFLVSASWARNPSLRTYGRNRFLRIYPGLWVCFAVSLATVFIFYTPQFRATEFAAWVVAQLSIVQFYNPDFLRSYGVGVLNGSLWTIPVELQFYVLLPFLMVFFSRYRWNRWLLGGVFLALVAANQVYVNLIQDGRSLPLKLLGVTVIPYLYMFLLGVILQQNLSFVARFLRGRAAPWLTVYVLLALAVDLLGGAYGGNYLNPIMAVALGLVTVACAYTGTGATLLLLHGRDLSYGAYLYHMVWVNALLAGFAFVPWANMGIMLLLTLISAWLSWTFVERPALSLKARKRAPQPALA